MKIRMLMLAVCLIYLPLLSNADAIVHSQNTPSSKSILTPLANSKHEHELVVVYGGEDIRPKQLNTHFFV